ncbi:hypothetical protein CR513_06171, partial [Mucuna pruriens]
MRSIQEIYDETKIINDLFCLFVDSEPLTFYEAMEDKRWRQAMEEEIKAIKKNDTCELSNLLKGHEIIGVEWVFKIKKNAKGKVERYKARLVAKGYKQQYGVDYDEVSNGLENLVKSTFLNGYLEKNVYEKVLKLKNVLYGLKGAPREWNNHIDKYFQDNELVRCQHEYGLFIKKIDNDDILLICLYLDNLISISNNTNLFEDIKKTMSCEFEKTNIGLVSYYLGLEVNQMNNVIFVSRESYTKKMLEKFKMFDFNLVNTPMECSMK